MKVIFRSKDFNSITAGGLGFNNRRPAAAPWHYQGRVQHARWQGVYECYWENAGSEMNRAPTGLVWMVSGDERLFGLAAALKARGITVEVKQE